MINTLVCIFATSIAWVVHSTFSIQFTGCRFSLGNFLDLFIVIFVTVFMCYIRVYLDFGCVHWPVLLLLSHDDGYLELSLFTLSCFVT